jgi:glucose/arabinose dehydrogenase
VLGVLKGEQLRVIGLSPDGWRSVAFSVSFPGQGRLRTPAVGPDGALYVTTGNGGNVDKILRFTPRAAVAGGPAT